MVVEYCYLLNMGTGSYNVIRESSLVFLTFLDLIGFSMQLILIKCVICCSLGLLGKLKIIDLLVLHPHLTLHFWSDFCLFLGSFHRGRHKRGNYLPFFFLIDLCWIFTISCFLNGWRSRFSLHFWEQG